MKRPKNERITLTIVFVIFVLYASVRYDVL